MGTFVVPAKPKPNQGTNRGPLWHYRVLSAYTKKKTVEEGAPEMGTFVLPAKQDTKRGPLWQYRILTPSDFASRTK